MDGKVSIRGAHEDECSRYSGFQQAIAAAGVVHANRTVNSEIGFMLFHMQADGNYLNAAAVQCQAMAGADKQILLNRKRPVDVLLRPRADGYPGALRK
jgi:hypothetical protein